MIQQILARTPIWVWAILAFLIYRGILASRDRETSLIKIFIIPIVMLGLSIQGIASTFGAAPIAGLTWLAGVVLGGGLAWGFFNRDSVTAEPRRGVVFQRGSWVPLMMMMGIFLTKYLVGMTLSMHSDYKHDAAFAGVACALYGLFNGAFFGKVLGIITVYRRVQRFPQLSPAV